MRRAAFAAFASLLAPSAFAQGLPAQGTAPDAGQTAPAAVQSADRSGPANLCQELLAFMKVPPPEAAASAAPGQNPSGENPRAAPSAAPSSEAVPPRSGGESNSAQEVSAQSGPAHSAPQPESSVKPENSTQDAELKSSLSAPVPIDAQSTPKTSVLSLEEAERLAEADDIARCQDAGRKLRLAGVAVPAPLLALTALDLRYHGAPAAR